MNKFEVRLEVVSNDSRTLVHTFIYADNAIQARGLALAMAGIGGQIIFGPYPVD